MEEVSESKPKALKTLQSKTKVIQEEEYYG
jgi:hypothetical protein